MVANKVDEGFKSTTTGETFTDFLVKVNGVVADYFTINPASVVLQNGYNYSDFIAAVENMKNDLAPSSMNDFEDFISDLNGYYNTGEGFSYDSYKTIADFQAAIKADLEQNLPEAQFKASAKKLAEDSSYSFSDFENEITKELIPEYFTIGTGPNNTSNSFSEFQQKISNLSLFVTTNTKGIRNYTQKQPMISEAEFTATLPKLNQTALNQVGSLLGQVLTNQQTQEQLLTSDIATAKQRNRIMETNLNGRIVINVGDHVEAETIVRALLANEHVKENVFAIKFDAFA